MIVPAIMLVGYSSRVLAERASLSFALAAPWVLSGLVLVSLALVAVRRCSDLTPVLLLSVYMFWPSINPTLALGLGLVVFIALLHQLLTTSELAGDALLGIASMSLYVSTLAPTILPADQGEFQLVSFVLGIAHPPGYALYTMLAKLFTLLPVGDVAYRVNLFAAVTSSLALVLLARVVRTLTRSTLAGWVASFALGTAVTFWAQATTANIRSLTALFTAAQLAALVAYASNRNSRTLSVFALLCGLGISHHGSTALFLVPYLIFLAWCDPELFRRPRRWLRPLLVFAGSFLVWLYLPLRSLMGAPFDPQPIRSVAAFMDHVLASGFRGDMFYFVQPTVLIPRLGVLANILRIQFPPALLVLAVLGAGAMAWRRLPLLILVGGVFLVNAMTVVTYRAPQTVEYLMPGYVALSLLIGYGAWAAGQVLAMRWRSPLLALVLLPAVLGLFGNYTSFGQLHADRTPRARAEQMLASAPAGGRILANWHYATPLWYLQYVEGVRRDVDVVYVYPQGAEPIGETWLSRLRASVEEGRPTIVTNYYTTFDGAPYVLQSFPGGYIAGSEANERVPETARPLNEVFDGKIRFRGYVIDRDSVTPGDALVLRVYWEPAVPLDRDHSFFVHLIDSAGVVQGQRDLTHSAARYAVGRLIVDEYSIPTLPAIRPGSYTLVAGTYITLPEGGWRRLTTSNGTDAIVLGEVTVGAATTPPATMHPVYRPFSSGHALVGVDYDRSVAGQLRVYLHWRAERTVDSCTVGLSAGGQELGRMTLPELIRGRYCTTVHDLTSGGLRLQVSGNDGTVARLLGPFGWSLPTTSLSLPEPGANARYVPLGGQMVLVGVDLPDAVRGEGVVQATVRFIGATAITNDYSVSLSLESTGGWQTQQDSTPALGAIPTLKWVRGMRVDDPHTLSLPSNAGGTATACLTVYDAFTLKPLPVLDDRLARAGQGTRVELGTVTVTR